MAFRQPDAKKLPNHPDVDLIDETTRYVVQVEVPGVKDVSKIKCQWSSSTHLAVTGDNTPPDQTEGANGHGVKEDESAKPLSSHTGTHEPSEFAPSPFIEERRLGIFRRDFSFPSNNIDGEKMTAKLEAGLLTLNIPKKSHHIPKGDGTIMIKQCD